MISLEFRILPRSLQFICAHTVSDFTGLQIDAPAIVEGAEILAIYLFYMVF